MLKKRIVRFCTGVCVLVLMAACSGAVWTGIAWAENMTPAQEQEFADAKAALEAARKIQADNYAPEPVKQAGDFLRAADTARQRKDAVVFSQASRLARAYADLAKTLAELSAGTEALAARREELEKTKVEIERLKKSP